MVGNQSLFFQQSALRLISSDLITFLQPVILTNSDFRLIVADQLQEVGIDPDHILIEREFKTTRLAILATSLCALKNDPNAVLLVAPSGHMILDEAEFHVALNLGLSEAKGVILLPLALLLLVLKLDTDTWNWPLLLTII